MSPVNDTSPRRGISASAIDDLKAYIDHADRVVKQDLKVWIMGTIMASSLTLAVPLAGVVFYLGSISNKLDAAFRVQSEQQVVLSNRGEWMDRRERVEESLVSWAKSKGYVQPDPVR